MVFLVPRTSEGKPDANPGRIRVEEKFHNVRLEIPLCVHGDEPWRCFGDIESHRSLALSGWVIFRKSVRDFTQMVSLQSRTLTRRLLSFAISALYKIFTLSSWWYSECSHESRVCLVYDIVSVDAAHLLF